MPLAKADLDSQFGRGGYELSQLAKLSFAMAKAMANQSYLAKREASGNG